MSVTIKENIVGLVMDQGYGFFYACEMVTKLLEELKAKKPGTYTYSIGKLSFKLTKGDQDEKKSPPKERKKEIEKNVV